MPVTDGEPAPGFVVGRISAEPATVQIVGPESHVREVDAATTEPVEIDGKNDRVRDVVTVGVLDSSVRLVEQPLSATVVIEILPAPIERDVPGVPVRSRNIAQGLVPQGRAGGRSRERPRPAGRAGAHPSRTASMPSSTLPGSGPAATAFVSRSILRKNSASAPYRRALSQSPSNERAEDCLVQMACVDGGGLPARPSHRGAAGRGARARHAAGDTRARGRQGRRPLRFVVGRDTRESGAWIEEELARGAGSEGASVTSAGVIPTPAIAYVTPAMGFDAGIVISASHNPFEDNGIKVFSGKGEKFTEALEREVEAIVARTDWSVPASAEARFDHTNVIDEYMAHTRLALPDPRGLRGAKIAIDTANGATTTVAPRLFKDLGFELVVLSGSPDGRNINLDCGSTHPEGLSRAVREQQCRMGVAFDGDGDRAIFADADGRIVDGDAVLLMCARHLKANGRLKGNAIVATVMSNIGLEIALRDSGIEMVRCPVGDKYVMEEMVRRDLSLGGEQSGHIIFAEHLFTGDGIATALNVLRVMAETNRELADLAGELVTYPQVLVNVRVREKKDLHDRPGDRRGDGAGRRRAWPARAGCWCATRGPSPCCG